MTRRKTKAQALQDLADCLGEFRDILSKLTPREAAERAWHPGGPSVEELTEQIAADGICRDTAEELEAQIVFADAADSARRG